MPSARVSLPGPLVRSSRPFTCRLRRIAARPVTGSAARISTQPRAALRLRYDVQAVMDAIDEIHVGVAGWSKDHFGSRRPPAPCMRRLIGQAEVGFGFDDSRRDAAVHQYLAQQRTRNLGCRTRVKASRQ